MNFVCKGTWFLRHFSLKYVSLTEIQCPFLPVPECGEVEVASHGVGGLATYTCNEGCRLSNPNITTRVCESSGKWSTLVPECEGEHCGNLRLQMILCEKYKMELFLWPEKYFPTISSCDMSST